MSMKQFLIGTLLSVLLILTVVGGSRATGFFHLSNGEAQTPWDSFPISPGYLYIPETAPGAANPAYKPNGNGKVISHPDGRPIAQLAHPSDTLAQSITVAMTPSKGSKEYRSIGDSIGWYLLATVKYSGNGHTVYVSTGRPSPKAQSQNIYLGKPTQLANGQQAWVMEGKLHQEGSNLSFNQVMMLHNDLLISVIGDQPLDQLKILAEDVEIKGNQP